MLVAENITVLGELKSKVSQGIILVFVRVFRINSRMEFFSNQKSTKVSPIFLFTLTVHFLLTYQV